MGKQSEDSITVFELARRLSDSCLATFYLSAVNFEASSGQVIKIGGARA